MAIGGGGRVPVTVTAVYRDDMEVQAAKVITDSGAILTVLMVRP